MTLISWFFLVNQTIQHDPFSQIHKLMSLMRWFFYSESKIMYFSSASIVGFLNE